MYISLKTQCNEFKHKGPESRVRGAKNLPCNNLRIGTLNVRTLAQSGSLESLKMDLKKYKLDVLGVQETRLEEREIDKCMAFQLDVSFCFIDFPAAFDSVDREMMYKIMKHNGLQQKVVNVIRNSYEGFKCCVKKEGEKGQMFDVKTGVRHGDVWTPILFGLVINYVLANSVQGGIDIGRCVADLDFADDVALLGVSDSEVQANIHRNESLAEAVGLMINVGKTKNMGVKCEKPGASVPIAQRNVEVLTGNRKGRFGTLIESENQSRLLIGKEVLVGKKKNAGWFETLAGEELRLQSSAEVELVTVSSDERSVVADLVSTANNR